MKQQQPQHRPPLAPKRFAWKRLLPPLAALVLLLLWSRRVTTAPGWSSLLDRLRVHDRLRFTELAVFALCLIAIVAIARTTRSP